MKKQQENRTRQEFLLTFFEDKGYEFKEINGFILEKRWDGNVDKWNVGIFTKESWTKKERAMKEFEERGRQQKHLLTM